MDYTAVVRKKSNIKAQITRIKNAIPKATNDVEILTANLDTLNKLQAKFEAIKDEIYATVKEGDFEDMEKDIDNVDEDFQNLEVSLKTSISKIKNDQLKEKVEDLPLTSQLIKNDQAKKALIKLPDIPLPTFSGKIEEWNVFKTQFTSLIHENGELSEREKLHYLQGTLKGDAKSIEVSDENYNSLFKALQERYENKRIIVDTHMKNILNLEAIKQESARDLRNLLDTVKKNLRALKVLEFERDKFSNAMLLNVMLNKLDRETRKTYELSLIDNEVPDFDTFLEFLERRFQILNSINRNIKSNPERTKTFFVKSGKTSKTCVACKNAIHQLYHCEKFKAMKLNDRYDLVKKHKLCFNCLSEFHVLSNCNSKHHCLVCKKVNHHSLLHKYFPTQESRNQSSDAINITNNITELSASPASEEKRFAFYTSGNAKDILINTAIIYVKTAAGERVALRGILDSASESSFVTHRAANILGLKRERINIPIIGLSETALNIKSKVLAEISNENNDANWDLELLIVPKITDVIPSRKLNIAEIKIPKRIKLADPNFSIPQRVDILLGAELFFELLRADKIKLNDNLILQECCFGYIVSGSIRNKCDLAVNHCFLSKNLVNLNKTLTSFWEVENIDNINPCNSEELSYCNEHFEKTHFRKEDGRFVVAMPFKPELSEKMLGGSKQNASARLDRLCQRLNNDPISKKLYSDFLKEYEMLGHMEQICEKENHEEGYYLPHHGVLRPTSQTTKLRVVFNASAKTSNKNSLNDLLCKGGVIQDDLFSILIRFRKHLYAFTTDIQKMFRMIEIEPSQRKLQKILWKDKISSPTNVFQLNTITYGMASSPYLATKALQQLAKDEKDKFPLAAKVVQQDFYMDDCLSGSSDPDEFERLKHELTQLLKQGGMSLHKWQSNKYQTDSSQPHIFPFDKNAEEIAVKTLGMMWNSASDNFTYKVSVEKNPNCTKRDVLSQIARIYDPLGLLGPVIAKAKIFMQQLWLLKLDWNQKLPPELLKGWQTFTRTLPEIESIRVPRCISLPDVNSITVIGFADASSKAYGACIYIHSTKTTNEETRHLLCSKSRVAPIKTITIPRLELSACLLLSKLVNKVLNALKQSVQCVNLYSDSTIALAWIKTSPHLLKTFVSNRVSQIQDLTRDFQWHHVSSPCNPADFISRGLDVTSLRNNELWWQGPELATLTVSSQKTNNSTDKLFLEELKVPSKLTLTSTKDSFFDNLMHLTNNYLKLIRILGFIFRFYNNCKCHNERNTGAITTEELERAQGTLVKYFQVRYFSQEISALQKGLAVSARSKLRFLHPFLDHNGLIRVGGRLANSNVNYNRKHPIVLPASNILVKLIFCYYHKRDLHTGPQALLNAVRQEFWPIGGRNIARKVVHECIPCAKANPIAITQIMGDLPPERVISNTPFLNVGLDLCGPFMIKFKGQRKGALQKVYVAIFICMVTKAIHLEFISDLTSEALIATLKRFFARRGKSSTIFSDNATNFVGACAELKRFQGLIPKREDISKFLTSEKVNWKFLPPRAPNFGGLWEAGVKSFKYHFKRAVGPAKLTLEEFITIISQIEGVLNSRPLTPLSTDTDDYQVLTPGHFLIGRPISAIPEPNLIEKRDNLLNRWQGAQKLVQIIWKRWENSYLSHLQQRNKWMFKKENITKGMLVVIKDSNLPVGKWQMARITNVYPGADGNIRVVDLRTPTGNFRRCISKICLLPVETEDIPSVI